MRAISQFVSLPPLRFSSDFGPQANVLSRAKIFHVIATIFHPPNRADLSAQAEVRHVITPLIA